MRRVFVCLVVVATFACEKQSTAPAAAATVAFKYDAPFCGPSLVEKSVDGKVVSTDSMVSGATSNLFALAPGDHRLGARQLRAVNGQMVANYTWPDTTVSFKAGAAVTWVLALYCS